MSNPNTSPAPRRTFLQWLFRCGLGNNLVTIWVSEVGQYAHGQTETETKIMLGRYTVLRWTKFYTPANG
jgi:hypothetical protein